MSDIKNKINISNVLGLNYFKRTLSCKSLKLRVDTGRNTTVIREDYL